MKEKAIRDSIDDSQENKGEDSLENDSDEED